MPGMELSDNQLAVLAGQGDADAYRRLFERYQKPVYNFVYRLVNNAEDASDVVQNAFLKLYTVLGEKEVQNFSAYLYRIARNLAYDEMRRRSRFADVDQELLTPEDPNIYADPQRALQLEEQIGTVRRAAEKLNENQRAALIMRELQDMDYEEMSLVLDSNRNAVGAMLSRARLRLREELRMAQVSTEKAPPQCEKIISLLSPYIDDELDRSTRVVVDGHLRDCTFCTAALEEMREASRSFRMLIPVVPPPGLAEAFEGGLQQLSRQGAMEAGFRSEAGPGPSARGSIFSRVLHSRVVWIGLTTITAISVSIFVLAESTSREHLIQEEQFVLEDVEQFGDDIFGEEEISQPAEPQGAPETPPADAESPLGPRPGQGEPQSQSTLSVGTVSIDPNPVWEDSQFTVTVTLYGSARAVTASIEGMYELQLQQVSSGEGSETWSATGTASGRGNYDVYINAIGTDNQSASKYGGILEVIYIY